MNDLHRTIANLKGQLIPVVTLEKQAEAYWAAVQLIEAGCKVLELSFRTEEAMEVVKRISPLAKERGVLLGIGTVKHKVLARHAFEYEAISFLASPCWVDGLQEMSLEYQKPWLAGVATPTEIQLAQNEGVELLKLFPATQLGGADLIKQYTAIFTTARLIPFGGIHPKEATSYLQAGAYAVGIGSALLPNSVELYNRDKSMYHKRVAPWFTK
jgi:2-dehydro-3-deoxyphosphogluconate aldolase/(4S)-4-hydroxy-2-oxoglutarate aldolase